MVVPANQICPECGNSFMGSDAIGRPCPICELAINYKPDMRGPAIAILGSITTGHSFYGPFDTVHDASEWSQTKTLNGMLGIDVSIVLLEQE